MPGLRWNVIDWCLALPLAALAEAQLAVYGHCCDFGRVSPAGYLLTLLETLPVAWRRRAPVSLILVSGGAAIAQVVLDSPVTDFSKVAVLVLCFTVASQSRQIVAVVTAALTPGGILAAATLHSRSTTPYDLMALYVQFAVAFGLGFAARHLRRLTAERVERLEREEEERERAAAAAERSRIARELHDVVAHALSVISINAIAAQSVMGTASDDLRACLLAIEAVSREAWAEMRLFLDGQEGGDGVEEPPRSGLAHLAELVERFEQTGLSIDLVVSGDVRPLPADIDLCAYRIVQESLTNVMRHAGQDWARVAIGYGERSVHLEIANPTGGSAPARAATGGHHGMESLRDRASLAGGELSVETNAERFTVRARLPVGVSG
jgi:signal transduction histidine kinase